MNYIVLSEKTWNAKLVEVLQERYSEHQFTLINKKEDFTVEQLEALKPDQIFIPHWSHIIPATIFEAYECIVFHMTDLPYGRGGSPLQNLIARGHKETKVSALRVVETLDGGPIYVKHPLSLLGTAEEIFIRTNGIVEKLIFDIIERKLQPEEQAGEATVFKRRTPAMSDIKDITELSELYDQIRMMDAEGYPHAFLETEHFRLEFTRASLKANETIISDVRIIKK